MVFKFVFPDVGEGITEGVIVKWKVKVGDTVKNDQNIAEIETDKAIVDIPSPKAGKIAKINYKVGETIKVGEVLVEIDTDAQASKPKKPDKATKQKKTKSAKYTGSVIGVVSDDATEIPAATKKSTSSKKVVHVKATLKVRKLAKELGIDIETIKGSGPNDRITFEDVKSGKTSAKTDSIVELKGLRKVVSENMSKSFQNTVPVTNFYDVDVTKLWNKRQKEKLSANKKGIKLTFVAYIVKAVAETLKNHPYLNSSLTGNKIELKKEYNIGVAVDTDDGLVVPVIKNADKKDLLNIAKEIVDLAERGRVRKLKIEEMKGGTFTVTNLGSIGVKYFTPVINYPEAAILGLGRIEEAIGTDNENIVLKKIMPLSLTYNHKIIDGATASRFMNEFIEKLKS